MSKAERQASPLNRRPSMHDPTGRRSATWSKSIAQSKSQPSRTELRAKLLPLFNKFDADNSGGFSLTEMKQMCKAIGREMKVSSARGGLHSRGACGWPIARVPLPYKLATRMRMQHALVHALAHALAHATHKRPSAPAFVPFEFVSSLYDPCPCTISLADSLVCLSLCVLRLLSQPQELQALMDDADADGSGVVDFEEFVSAVHRSGGSGGLAVVANDASSFFGFLNPFGWFGSSAPSTAVELPAKGLPAKPQAQHRGSSLPRPPNGSGSFKNEARDITPRSVGSRIGSPTGSRIPMRIMMSECEIKYAQGMGLMDIRGGKWVPTEPETQPEFPSWLFTAYGGIDRRLDA